MGFLAPWFFAGFVAIGLPFWLHLLRKHRSTPLPFSSLMFFERRTQSSIKHRRLRYLVLLSLRTALFLLLALAFANPFYTRANPPAASGRKLLVLAIDNSFSMRQGDRLARAKQQASGALSKLSSGDRAQVVAFGSQVHMMTDATDDPAALRAGIQAVEPTDTRGSFAELARALRSMAQAAKTPVEVHLFSDMQKSGMPGNFADLRLADNIQFVPHSLASQTGNFTVENVKVPRRVYNSRKVRVQATVAGFGTEKTTRRVALVLNGRLVDSKNVEIPEHGRAIAEFLSLEAPFGMNRGEVRIEPSDAFPADDRFLFSIERAEPRPALFVHEGNNQRGLLYFRTALDAGTEAAFQIDAVNAEQTANISPTRYAFVVVSDIAGLPPSFEEALKHYVSDGGSVLVALGPASRVRVPVTGQPVLENRVFSRDAERFQGAGRLDSSHPSIGSNGSWQDVKFIQAVRIDPGKGRTVARLSDDSPLLVEQAIGAGRVLVFASTFDNVSNDFPLHPSFVPFIEQTAHYLGRLDTRPANYTVDAWLELRNQGGPANETVEVLDPRGERALSLREATRARSIQLTSAGFYDVRRPNGAHELVAVNPDRHESDLDIIPAETLALWQNTAQGTQSAEAGGVNERKPVSLWWYVMAAVLALAVAESLLGNRHLSAEGEAVEEVKKEAAA